jgi:hypothetical protein
VSALGGHRSGDVGSTDAFERETIAGAIVDQAAQRLGDRHACVATGQRRQRGDAVSDLVRADQQAIGGHDLVDHAVVLAVSASSVCRVSKK